MVMLLNAVKNITKYDYKNCFCLFLLSLSLSLCLFFFCFYNRTFCTWKFPGSGVELELHLQPTPQPQQHWIRATSATYATAWGNTRSLTHWLRPGIKPASPLRQCLVLNLLSHNGNSCFCVSSARNLTINFTFQKSQGPCTYYIS